MARTLTDLQVTNYSAVATRPIFLVHWNHSGSEEFLSCSGDVTFQSQVYTSGGININSIEGSKTASISVFATASRVTELQDNTWRKGFCKIYSIAAAPSDGTTFTDGVLILDGLIDDSSFAGETVTVRVKSKYYVGSLVPSLKLNDIARHMPRVGEGATWEGDSIFYEEGLVPYLGGGSLKNSLDPTVSGRSSVAYNNSYEQALNSGYIPLTGDGILLPLVYGRTPVPGYVFVDKTFGGKKYFGVAWCLGECFSIEQVYLDDVAPVTGVEVRHYRGTAVQGIDSWLAAAVTNYGDDMIFEAEDRKIGVCYSVFKIDALALGGVPKFRATIKGRIVEEAVPAITNFDEDFASVTMLLHAEETIGTAVVDSSATPIGVGKASLCDQSAAQSKWGAQSFNFPTSNDYLNIGTSLNVHNPTNDFTMEAWVYITSLGTHRSLWESSNTTRGYKFWISTTNGYLSLDGYNTGGGKTLTISGAQNGFKVVTNTWQHIALTREGTTWYAFVDGNLQFSAVESGLVAITHNPFRIGQVVSKTTLPGYMDDIRSTDGVARYNASFTPPNEVFYHAVAATSLPDPYHEFLGINIVFDQAASEDASDNAHVITLVGGATDDATGLHLDGVGDYATIPDDATLDVAGQEFTFEIRAEATAIGAGVETLISHGTSGTTRSMQVDRSTAALLLYLSSDGTTWDIANGVNVGTLVAATQFDFCLERIGDEFIGYLDGVQTWRKFSANDIHDSTTVWELGAFNATQEWTGIINAWRYLIGYVRYGSPHDVTLQSPYSDSNDYPENSAYSDSPALCWSDLARDTYIGLSATVDGAYESMLWNREIMESGLIRNRMGLAISESRRVEEWLDQLVVYADCIYFPEGENLKIVPDQLVREENPTGVDLVVNGVFDADTDWTKGTGWTIAGGVAVSDGTQTADSLLEQTLTLEVGVEYAVSFEITTAPATGFVHVKLDAQVAIGDQDVLGVYYGLIVAENVSADIEVVADLDFDGEIDNVTVIPLHRVVTDWVKGSLTIEGLSEFGTPNAVMVKYTDIIADTAVPEEGVFTVFKNFGDFPIVKTILDLPGVFRSSEAKNKSLTKVARMVDRSRVTFVGTDSSILFQEGDDIRLLSTLRGVDLVMWVESVVMTSYGRHRVTGILYGDMHFSDSVSRNGLRNDDVVPIVVEKTVLDNEGNSITILEHEAVVDYFEDPDPCQQHLVNIPLFGGSWALDDENVDSNPGGAVPVAGAPEPAGLTRSASSHKCGISLGGCGKGYAWQVQPPSTGSASFTVDTIIGTPYLCRFSIYIKFSGGTGFNPYKFTDSLLGAHNVATDTGETVTGITYFSVDGSPARVEIPLGIPDDGEWHWFHITHTQSTFTVQLDSVTISKPLIENGISSGRVTSSVTAIINCQYLTRLFSFTG